MGKVIRRTQNERDLAVEIVKNGGSFKEASSKTGYGVDYVRQLCTKAGVHEPKFRIIPEKEEAAVYLIKQGYTVEEIAERLDYKTETVKSIFYRHRFKQVSNATKEKRKRNERILEMRKRKISMSDISKKVGASMGVVAYVCKNNNLGGKMAIQKNETRYCKKCGKPFECHPKSNQLFCTRDCQKAYHHATNDIIRRKREKEVIIDNDITLEKVAKRDHNICQICGEPVNWNDYKIVNGKKVSLGDYPSRDHIVPICKGGLHSWDNIRLAHIRCNSKKGARTNG